ncbi:MAG: endolytic transglycosylase MltG [Patescibacteria group bacterium]
MKLIKLLLIAIIIFIIFFGFSYYRGINRAVDKNGSDINFIINPGESVEQIAENLAKEELIKSVFYFKLYIWRADKESKLQAGEYILNPRQSIKEIVEIFVAGESASQERTIKIIEGWSLRDIAFYFENLGMYQAEEIMELAGLPLVDYRGKNNMEWPKDYSSEFSSLGDKPKYYSYEGYLFPDTYRVFKDAEMDDIIKKMLNNFDKKLTAEMRKDIANQGKSIYQIVTMASIIEKEGRNFKDMSIISGLFWDRIKNGQPLQSDATLTYIFSDDKPAHTTEETKVDSPYNTYLILGLPPGPICNPSLNAIKAAIYPEYTDYNYFLHRLDTGETIFSKTYDEHLNNKARYLR